MYSKIYVDLSAKVLNRSNKRFKDVKLLQMVCILNVIMYHIDQNIRLFFSLEKRPRKKPHPKGGSSHIQGRPIFESIRYFTIGWGVF